MSEKRYDRILGCMVGSAIGDSFGAVVEFARADRVRQIAGSDWVAEFLPFPEDFGTHPAGVWEKGPPRGTGTDDTRYNHVFVECVVRNGGAINSQLLAIEYLERYRDRATFYPRHADLAEKWLNHIYEKSCAYLGMKELASGQPSWVAATQGNSFPILWGLISLAFVGLLYMAEPEKAYEKAYELAYYDLAYARDTTAMMAAMVSAALGEEVSGREMVEIGLNTNPFRFSRRFAEQEIRQLIELAKAAENDRALVDLIGAKVRHRHGFDPIDVLGQPAAAVHFCDGDPVRSIVMAANDRNVDDDGDLLQLRDVDCTAGVAGALVGALRGVGAFPSDWIGDALKANKEIYGIDIEANAERFDQAVYGS
jgi:ADP-ribosylglycohydrolase